MNHRQHIVPVVIILLVMWGLLTLRMDALWFGHHEENGRWISTAARNYVIYGADNLNYLVTTTPYPTDETEVYRYVHHPPLVVWFVSLSSDIFGRYDEASPYVVGTPYEFAARIVTIFSTMVSLAAFFVIVRRLYTPRIALLALLLYTFTPMIAYFGRMVNHEPLALAFLYIFIAIFINWMRRYTHQRTILLIIFASLAMWSAWAPAFFFVTLGIIALIFGKISHRTGIIAIGVVVGLITSIIPIYYAFAHEETFPKLQEAFLFRTSNQSRSRGSTTFTFMGFIVQQITHMLTAMGFALVVLGSIGIGLVVRLKDRFSDAVVLAMLVAGVLYMLVFRNAFYVHDYYKIYFMPSFAVAAAIVVNHTLSIKRRNILRRLGRPLIVSVIIISTVLSVFWLNILHRSGDNEFPNAIVASISQYTNEYDIIYTNIIDSVAAFQYYSYREVYTASSLEQSLSLAEQQEVVSWYLSCRLGEEEAVKLGVDEMQTYDVADICQLIRLRDADE